MLTVLSSRLTTTLGRERGDRRGDRDYTCVNVETGTSHRCVRKGVFACPTLGVGVALSQSSRNPPLLKGFDLGVLTPNTESFPGSLREREGDTVPVSLPHTVGPSPGVVLGGYDVGVRWKVGGLDTLCLRTTNLRSVTTKQCRRNRRTLLLRVAGCLYR